MVHTNHTLGYPQIVSRCPFILTRDDFSHGQQMDLDITFGQNLVRPWVHGRVYGASEVGQRSFVALCANRLHELPAVEKQWHI